jgi:hypothetical protein
MNNSYSVKATKAEYMNIFADEITRYIDRARLLPFGILSVVTKILKNIETGDVYESFPYLQDGNVGDLILFSETLHMVAATLLTKRERMLMFTDEDLDELDKIIYHMFNALARVQNYYAGVLDAQFVDNRWNYSITEAGVKEAERYLKRQETDP